MLKTKATFHPFNSDEFLPPVSIWTKIAGFFLLGTVGTVITLASFLKYSVTVKGTSLVRPLGEIRLVEAQIEGTIKNIAVEKNQIVKKGDIIAFLDRTQLETQKSRLEETIEQMELKQAQIDAQLQLQGEQIIAESQSLEQDILIAQIELNRIKQEYQTQEISAQANFEEVQSALELAQDEMQRYEELVATGSISQLQFNEKQAAFKTATARLKTAQAGINPHRGIVIVAQEKITQAEAKKTATIANLNQEREFLIQSRLQLETRIIQEQKQLQQTATELEKSIIRATVDGVILQLNLRNEQEFVTANEVIAEIMPDDVDLVIKTFISNQDLDQVKIGQTAKLQINACPYPDYGILDGVVTAISPDVVKLNNNLIPANNSLKYFEVTIKPEKLSLRNGNRECQIQPGMEAQASIISRQETFLQFIFRKARLFSNF
ncbi:MAG: HlyD family efflux transporter periplasmic adaptor subunit [Gomphosphaeria aponina SAG 52.96 = DSM 107014]|uniref:HlyD family efflux transporter periplasmic adaptor subunit n=1 Tax=Gomphosphaeria aponina SAG 52.96 = DSM 107014 TaxID=1521640 RepID=A0A941GPE1_9CHRO|nr:HlyD family efflux transporter periplasmic adaptor subunit [Gomphosphaeria aponina SAG 52.96 = DSM 107014]